MRATVLIRPKPGILDPQGEAVGSALGHLGFEVKRRARRQGDRPRARGGGRRGGQGAGGEDVRAAAREPADRVVRGRDRWLARSRGSASSPIPARRTTGTRSGRSPRSTPRRWRSGTRSPSCRTSTRSSLPGGFSYGDYLRCGAIARFSPATAAVCEFADGRRLRARDLQRLPDPLRGGPAAGSAAAQRVAPLRLPRRAADGRAQRPAVHLPLHRRADGSCCR